MVGYKVSDFFFHVSATSHLYDIRHWHQSDQHISIILFEYYISQNVFSIHLSPYLTDKSVGHRPVPVYSLWVPRNLLVMLGVRSMFFLHHRMSRTNQSNRARLCLS